MRKIKVLAAVHPLVHLQLISEAGGARIQFFFFFFWLEWMNLQMFQITVSSFCRETSAGSLHLMVWLRESLCQIIRVIKYLCKPETSYPWHTFPPLTPLSASCVTALSSWPWTAGLISTHLKSQIVACQCHETHTDFSTLTSSNTKKPVDRIREDGNKMKSEGWFRNMAAQ